MPCKGRGRVKTVERRPALPLVLAAGLVGLASFLAMGSWLGQAGSTGPEPPVEPVAATGKFSDEELSAFAAAYLEATRLRTSYDARIVMAKDPDRAAELRREAEARVTRAIEQSGLSRDDYERIFRAFSRDEAVRAKVNRYLVEQP